MGGWVEGWFGGGNSGNDVATTAFIGIVFIKHETIFLDPRTP